MKQQEFDWTYMVLPLIFLIAMGTELNKERRNSSEQSSSFVGYSQSCWQINDTLHVVTARGDTVRLDVSRLEGER